MATQEVEVAQARLADLVAAAESGDEVVLTRQGQPVARLVPADRQGFTAPRGPRKAGSAEGLFRVPDDFDAPLEDFRDYHV